MGLLDLLFPKYCVSCKRIGDFLCPDCFALLTFNTHVSCVVCNKHSLDGLTHPICRGKSTIDGIFASIGYNKTARKLLYTFKYKPYVSKLDSFLGELFYEGLIQQEPFNNVLVARPILVPIPLFPSKLRKRGYNHATLLSQQLSKKLQLEHKDLLIRKKSTLSQYGLNRKERQENIQGAFGLSTPNPNFSQSVFLVDDIVTTGSTFLEAAKILKKSGVKKVWGIALARD